jgi:hypothetical protein
MIQGFTRNRPALSARNGCIEGRSRYRTAKSKGSSREWFSRGIGGRLSRSSEEIRENGWSEGLSLFRFDIINKPLKQ